jgi:xanthine dehydrogenase accessory factor
MLKDSIDSKAEWHQAVAWLAKNHLPYVLLTLLGVQGSTPRDNGTKMVIADLNGEPSVWGTIGGGRFEFKVTDMARQMLSEGRFSQHIEHVPLGANLGQCCGGRASVLLEGFAGAEMTIALFGAGHVGRALATILSELPCRLHWVDSRASEFPAVVASNTVMHVVDDVNQVVAKLPAQSYYLVMTHEHALDFEVIEQALKREDARYIGLIGSQTKWRRFQRRFIDHGYPPTWSKPVNCPIGLSQVPGKRPMEVAVSIAAQLIAEHHSSKDYSNQKQGISWRDLKPVSEQLDEVFAEAKLLQHS